MKPAIIIAIIVAIAIVVAIVIYRQQHQNRPMQSLILPPSAFDQTYEGQGTVDAYTYNPYIDKFVPWRSSSIPHAPITFRPDNPDKEDYGSENIIKWDLEKTKHYFPYKHYNDYGI